MGVDLYYYIEGVNTDGVLENISPMLGPEDKNDINHLDMIESKYHYLYGVPTPSDDFIPRSSSLYDIIKNNKNVLTVDLEGDIYLEIISQITRDMLVHFSDASLTRVIYLEDLEEIYKSLEGWNKRYLKGTIKKLRKYKEEGYKEVKIVFNFN